MEHTITGCCGCPMVLPTDIGWRCWHPANTHGARRGAAPDKAPDWCPLRTEPLTLTLKVETWRDVMPPIDGNTYNLDNPSEFGEVLRWLGLEPGVDTIVIFRWVGGKTTEADRLTLARACAEVA